MGYMLGPGDYEIGVAESMTIPAQAYTIAELYEKYSHGIVLNVMKKGVYDDRESSVDFESNVDKLTAMTLANEMVNEHYRKLNDAKSKNAISDVKPMEKEPAYQTAPHEVRSQVDKPATETEV